MSQEISEKAPELPPRSAQRNSQATSEHATPSPPLQPSHTQTSQPSQPSQHPSQQPVQQPAQARGAHQQPAFPAFIPAPTAPQPEPKTFRERLNAGDDHWQWKLALRVILIFVGIIGIGCAAWTVATFTNRGPYEYELDDGWSMPWTLITFSISVIWSAICILVFFLRRPNAPVHPGCQVGIDLILWLAFIPTAMFAVLAVMSVMNFGSDGLIGEYSSYGYYHYVPSNNTWVWNATSYDSYYGNSRDCNSSSSSYSSYYGNGYGFANCADEDAYVNNLWKEKNHRFNTELTATVCQFIALLVHFALFVWACIDTHRRNSRKTGKDAEQLAADIVMNMVRSGAIIPPPGQAHMRPMGGPQMMPPHMMQQYPQQYFQQFHPQGPVAPPQPAVASSSNEKGVGPRYA